MFKSKHHYVFSNNPDALITDDSNVPEDKVENIKSFVMKMRIP